MTEKIRHYAFYGTLRKGLDNYRHCASELKYLRTIVIAGFKMHSLIDYPYAVRTADPLHTIKADLFEIIDPETEEMIYEMELEAGYILSNIEVDGTKFGIYLFNQSHPNHAVIGHGDWTLWLKEVPF